MEKIVLTIEKESYRLTKLTAGERFHPCGSCDIHAYCQNVFRGCLADMYAKKETGSLCFKIIK
jgi:hypothetical protein